MITQVTIITDAGGSQTITVQDFEERQDVEFFNEFRSVGGRRYKDISGSRGRYTISYNRSIEQSLFRSIINNIVTDMTGGFDDITIIIDGDYHVVVPTDSFLHRVEYARQIGGFVPEMEFIDVGINRFSGTYVESGFVEPGYVE